MTRFDALRTVIAGMVLGALAMLAIATVVNANRSPDGIDCLRSGQTVCMVDGVMVANLRDLPTDPYDRCLYLLSLSTLSGGVDMAAETCETIEENR